jgi:hypothetical protein
MTPQQKAIYLFSEYYSYLKANLMYDEEAKEDAIVCSLIAVNELIKYTQCSSEFGGTVTSETIEYWEEVKQRIEKI